MRKEKGVMSGEKKSVGVGGSWSW
uniref:Uncharacterized protein n=1 Tax=Rhizophora mucronata TaxID=61149 RepID=A0A2P2KP91_RHIMU